MSQLDSNAIKEIVKLTTTAFSGENLPLTECPVALLPDNVNIESLERFMTERFRFRGVMTTTSIDDFVEYSKGYADECSRCFINAETMKAVTVFNIGTLEQPGHADNKALLELKATSPYRALRDVDGKRQLQKSLAEWLEDWADFLTAYDSDGNVLDIKQAISAIRRLTIDAKRSAEYEEQNFSGSRSVMESVEAKSKEIMPATFRFECIPYEGLGNREFTLRLSILTSEQELKDYGVDIDALNAFKFLAGPETVLALLDEINALEETRINDVCRIAELTKQLELAKSKLNEQREYYEGVISDGSKRIAELEAREIKPAKGEVLVVVSGFTGCGKSAIAGEIEIAMKAIGVPVKWTNGDAEKRMTGADWLTAIEMYKPTVRIVEVNVPRAAGIRIKGGE